MRKYTQEHEWVDIHEDIATVGITPYAAEQLGDIVFVELPEIGKNVKKKTETAIVESTKAASDIYAPLAGVITEVNENLLEKPEEINQNPETTWFFKIKIQTSQDTLELLDAPLV